MLFGHAFLDFVSLCSQFSIHDKVQNVLHFCLFLLLQFRLASAVGADDAACIGLCHNLYLSRFS